MKKAWRHSVILLVLALVGIQSVFRPVVSVADRSLYLSFDKPLYASGETVKITVQIAAESCKQHDHLFELYVYDSRNLLLSQIAGERPGGLVLRPEDFPFTLGYTPPKADVYTVKLWVTHSPLSWGHRTPYLEDTAALTVVPYLTTTQTTTTQATTSQTTTVQLTTTASMPTTKPTVSTRTTATETEAARIDLTSPFAMMSMLLVIAAVIAVGLVAFRRRKNRGQLPSRAKTSAIPENRYCIQCGKEIPADAAFCTKCGAKQGT